MPGGTIAPCQSCKRLLIFGQVCVCGWNTHLNARPLTAEELATKRCQSGHRAHYISRCGNWWLGDVSDLVLEKCARRW